MTLRHGVLICVFASLFVTISVFAQAGARGGGEITEADMQTYINRLNAYLATPAGLSAFPEVMIHDLTTKPSFQEIASVTYPVAKEGVQYDQFGNARTCVSYADSSKRYFVCDQSEMDTSLANQPGDYEIILHELFVQSGIEEPVAADVPSEYKVSSKILNHLFQDPGLGFLPGDLPQNPISGGGLWCTDQPSLLGSEVATQTEINFLFWSANGDVRFTKWSSGAFQDLFVGNMPLPLSMDAATFPPASPFGTAYKYAPLHLISAITSESLWLAMNDNLLMTAASTDISGASGIWTQILANAIINLPSTAPNPGVESHLVACQAMESWESSSFYPVLNSALNSSPKTKP